MERARGVPEGAGGFPRRSAFDEIGPQSLVLPLLGWAGFQEEAPDLTYVFRCSDMSIITVPLT